MASTLSLAKMVTATKLSTANPWILSTDFGEYKKRIQYDGEDWGNYCSILGAELSLSKALLQSELNFRGAMQDQISILSRQNEELKSQLHEALASRPPAILDIATCREWEVVRGKRDGVLARTGQDLNSPETIPPRLAFGAIVREKARVGRRIEFELISGSGPTTGWVSLQCSGKDLLVRRPSPSIPGNDDSGCDTEESCPVRSDAASADVAAGDACVDALALQDSPTARTEHFVIGDPPAASLTAEVQEDSQSDKSLNRSPSLTDLYDSGPDAQIEVLRQVIRDLEEQLRDAKRPRAADEVG